MKKAIYAFSGDPITYGHIDIIERAARIFDEVTVAIGINPAKKYLFSLEERKELALRSLTGIKNVKVVAFRGLLVDYAFENNIPVIIKGLRNHEDFAFEMVLHQVGESQKLGIDTFFIPSRQELQHVSSGAVKAIQLEQGTLTGFVPMVVKQKLEERLSGQFFIGIVNANDRIMNELLQAKNELPVTMIDVNTLQEEIKNAADEKNQDQALIVKIRKAVYGKQGLILLKMDESLSVKLSYLCNNNILWLAPGVASPVSLVNTLEEKIKKDNNGSLLILEKTDQEIKEKIQLFIGNIISSAEKIKSGGALA